MMVRSTLPQLGVFALAVLLSSCGGGGSTVASPSSAATASTLAEGSTLAAGTVSPTTSAVDDGTTVSTTSIKTVSVFYSPSKAISCELDTTTPADGAGQPAAHSAYCETTNPPLSVSLREDGSVTTCAGDQCIGDPGTDVPVLPVGSSSTVGPFTCTSADTEIRCTTTNGKGFTIGGAGVAPIGGAVLDGVARPATATSTSP
jgi:hypothetical protein